MPITLVQAKTELMLLVGLFSPYKNLIIFDQRKCYLDQDGKTASLATLQPKNGLFKIRLTEEGGVEIKDLHETIIRSNKES